MNNYVIPENAYIHANELSQFIYVQVPMNLITSKIFSKISGDAKILYGLLLNRTGLSVVNGWNDDKGRTYINYTIEDIMAEMHISHTKASRLFSELTNMVVVGTDEKEQDVWFGLIEKIRVQNKPSRIYVHKVETVEQIITDLLNDNSDNTDPGVNSEEGDQCTETETSGHNDQNPDEETSGHDDQNPDEETSGHSDQNPDEETSGHNDQKFETEPLRNHVNTGRPKNRMTVITDIGRRSSRKQDYGRHKNRTTVVSDMRRRSSRIQDENNNNIINNYMSNNYPINPIKEDDVDGQINTAYELIKDNIEYDDIVSDGRVNKKKLDELIELMVEACVFGGDMKIGGRMIPNSMIRSRFEKYDRYTMEYVIESLSGNTTEVRNVKQYLLTTLYNAPVTMENHISLMVQHDLC